MKIDKEVGMPKKRTTLKKGQSKYPLKSMEVNDSFELDENKRFSVNVIARKYGMESGKEFTVRRDENGKMRCWRIK